MALPKNLIAASVKLPLLTWAHIPRRRKRHYFKSKMSLLLLIFVSCCLTLIFYPLNVQANDLDATSSKDGNMLTYDHRSKSSLSADNVLDEVEENAKTDKTNDNSIFEKIQQKKLENKNVGGYSSEEETQRSSEIIEMLQPSHTLRHQEHFQQQQQQNDPLKQKIRKHFEYQHEQQQNYDVNSDIDDDLYDDDDDDDDNDDDEDKDDGSNDDEEHNRRLRYQQIQEALREPITSPTPHHHRHEHHLEKKILSQQTELKLVQHHLRHQHRQHNELHSYRQPQLRQLNHEMKQQNFTNYSGVRAKHHHQRYFDRQSSYSTPFVSTATTEGPHFHLPTSNRYWKSTANEYLVNPQNQLFNDNADAHAGDIADANTNIDINQEKDIKRFSLPLGDNVNEDKGSDNPTSLSKEEEDANYDISIDDYGANEDSDYSYEDDDKEENKQNKYPSIPSTTSKTNVKRYSNPLRLLNKPNRHMENDQKFKNLAYHMKKFKLNSNDDDDDYDDEDIIKTSTSASASSLSSNASDALLKENDDVKFSEEKWRQIEHEHYRKQLQHQRDMQALRYRRPINENSSPPHRYSSYSAASINPSPIHSNSWTKRQTVNNDNDGNIYSRYYVPGIMSQKKEEELGSPKAILESRRQYALQQRQNKALASAHHRRIVTEGFCRVPQPRVERIRRDSWKIYTPHCTILHRCADDAGCCPSERQTCAPKRTKTVELYFFVISLNETQGSIEKLTFINHTECHCIERSKQRAPEYGNSRTKELISYNQIPFLRRATILNCYCPNLFEKILQEDGYCRCDCSSGNMGCDWLKRGMEHFSMNDRKCITEGRCKLPTCEYGQYIKKHGRCPRREERHLSADVDW